MKPNQELSYQGWLNIIPRRLLNLKVVGNLKPSKMRGMVSEGMVLCASTKGKERVTLIRPPAMSAVGISSHLIVQ